MRKAWKNHLILSDWQRAVVVFIPKEANSKDISQFRNMALLNVEGKIFFSVTARRTTYLLEKGYIDTNCQKAGVPVFSVRDWDPGPRREQDWGQKQNWVRGLRLDLGLELRLGLDLKLGRNQ